MSWVNDLASELGVPAGAATLAVAMYAACSAAEKAARPEALMDIARVLKDASWSRSASPAAAIGRIFTLTFGKRHFSWLCVRRSFAATAIVVTATLFVFAISGIFRWAVIFGTARRWPLYCLIEFIISGAIPDYLALGKTRYIIGLVSGRTKSSTTMAALIAFDLASSVLLSLVCFLAYSYFIIFLNIHAGYIFDYTIAVANSDGWGWDGMAASGLMAGMLALSTLFTSLWTILILLATALVKLAAPVQRLTAWFFDVDKHPLVAIGIVAATLIMAGSLLWSIARAAI